MQTFWTITGQLLGGFSSSFFLFLFTLLLSLPLGLLISFCTMSRFKPLSIPFKLIVWVLRGTPLMLQIFVVFYVPGLLFGFVWPTMNTGWLWFDKTISTRFIAALVAFVINYAAYFSEIFRGGIQSISEGQYEACQVLGMTRTEAFFKVVLLQVVKRVLAPMSNEVITLVKDTALANVIGVCELMYWGENALTTGGLIWPVFYAGGFYLLFVGLLTILFSYFEKRLDYFKA
ncbi:MAG: amino acid ABC transporter permease [Clostridia bacterium]|nr:amino acid ABC transporter permease [Clostridia bacterium]